MVNASKREVYFHVESQHLSEFAIPYHIWSLAGANTKMKLR
jgi:hypothetical protein